MTVRVVVVIALPIGGWRPDFEQPSSSVFRDMCDRVNERSRAQNALQGFNYRSQSCPRIRRRNRNSRRKRQSEEIEEAEIEVDTAYSFDQDMDLAEQSQVTYTLQENFANDPDPIEIPALGPDVTGEIVERAQLIEAEGLNLNETGGGEQITEVCYLFNLVGQCLEGSVCVETENNMPMCECEEGFSGDRCDEQVVSALSTSTIFLLAACIGLFFALLGLCFSHVYHMKRLHALERFVGYRYHMIVMDQEQYAQNRRPVSTTDASTWDRPRSWLPQPIRRHHGQSPSYFSHWS